MLCFAFVFLVVIVVPTIDTDEVSTLLFCLVATSTDDGDDEEEEEEEDGPTSIVLVPFFRSLRSRMLRRRRFRLILDELPAAKASSSSGMAKVRW